MDRFFNDIFKSIQFCSKGLVAYLDVFSSEWGKPSPF